MKNTIIITLIIILGILGLAFWGSKKQNSASNINQKTDSKSYLVASETLYDFGIISMKNGVVTKQITITNPTDKDILVSSATTSCMCTKVFITGENGDKKGPFGMQHGGGYIPPVNETIKPGGSRLIEIAYDPNAHGPAGVGYINRAINIIDSNGGDLQIEIKATVTP